MGVEIERTFRVTDSEMLTEEYLRGLEDGEHVLFESLDGVRVEADVQDGHIVGARASRDGKDLEVTFVTEQSVSGQADAAAKRPCFACFCDENGDCTCFKVSCKAVLV